MLKILNPFQSIDFFNIINKLFSLKVWNTKDLKTFIDKSLLLF